VEEKRRDLKSTKQKAILEGVISELSKTNPSFYYLSTSEIAFEIKSYLSETQNTKGSMTKDEIEIVAPLSSRDIQMLLSLH